MYNYKLEDPRERASGRGEKRGIFSFEMSVPPYHAADCVRLPSSGPPFVLIYTQENPKKRRERGLSTVYLSPQNRTTSRTILCTG
jgi:hypothetical protein